MSEQRLLTLYPYLIDGVCWVFDDERTGLKEEAFVLGTSEMITRVVEAKRIPDATRGFALSSSDRPFDGYDVVRRWTRSDGGSGTWYEGGGARAADGELALPRPAPLLRRPAAAALRSL